MDSFHEQLVTTHKTAKYTMANGATYVLGVLGIMLLGSGNVLGMIPGVLLLGAAVGLFFLKRNFYVEYEYDFTNGELDIDKIYEMKKRKRVISFAIKNLDLLAPEDSYHVKDYSNKPDKVLKLYPDTTEAKVWVAMLTGGTERAMIKFVPNEELIELCYKYNPRAVKKSI